MQRLFASFQVISIVSNKIMPKKISFCILFCLQRLLDVVLVSELFEVGWPRGPNSCEYGKTAACFLCPISLIIEHVKLSLAHQL